MYTYSDYVESAEYIKEYLMGFTPDILIVLGSGLGFLADKIEEAVIVDYKDIPHFKTSTAPGHKGRFVFGKLSGKNVVVMQGRLHHYEGYSGADIAYPINVSKLLGVHSMIITNACGGVNTDYNVGDLMIIKDHIKFFDLNPLIGANLPEFGERFFDMTYTYYPQYREIAKDIGQKLNINIREGVYFYTTGPQFETPAEIKAIRMLGGDVCGMSTVPEVIASHHCGIKILGISLVTNMAAGVSDKQITGDEVLYEADRAKERFSSLILNILPQMKG